MGTTRSKERVTKPCEHCGQPVTRLKSADAPRFYCNKACYWASSSRAEAARKVGQLRFPQGSKEVRCAQCGKTYTRAASTAKVLNFCTRDCQYGYRRGLGKSFINASGYVVVGVPAGHPGSRPNGANSAQIVEHRKVMQEFLGRELLPEENVHHINGIRTDNRPENLELWTRSQPSGQRVKDKVAWAKYIIETYGGAFD